MEAKLHAQNSFITLTYDDDHLPEFNNLDKEAMPLFFKRLRKALSPKKIRFYYVGEYGDQTGRPHYHALIFGEDFSHDRKIYKQTRRGDFLYNSAILSSCWRYGFSVVADFSFESAAYVARYCLKKQVGHQNYSGPDEIACDVATGEIICRVPEFGQPSRRPGIAADFYARFGEDIRRTDFTVMRNKKMLPPRYFDKLTEKFFPDEYFAIKQLRSCNLPQDHITLDQAIELRQAGRARSLLQKSGHLKGKL